MANLPATSSTPIPPAAVSREEFNDLKDMFNDMAVAFEEIKGDLCAEKENLVSMSAKIELLETDTIPGVKRIAKSKKVSLLCNYFFGLELELELKLV